jgi:hypothetical protein
MLVVPVCVNADLHSADTSISVFRRGYMRARYAHEEMRRDVRVGLLTQLVRETFRETLDSRLGRVVRPVSPEGRQHPQGQPMVDQGSRDVRDTALRTRIDDHRWVLLVEHRLQHPQTQHEGHCSNTVTTGLTGTNVCWTFTTLFCAHVSPGTFPLG